MAHKDEGSVPVSHHGQMPQLPYCYGCQTPVPVQCKSTIPIYYQLSQRQLHIINMHVYQYVVPPQHQGDRAWTAQISPHDHVPPDVHSMPRITPGEYKVLATGLAS